MSLSSHYYLFVCLNIVIWLKVHAISVDKNYSRVTNGDSKSGSGCPYNDWSSHQLKIVQYSNTSLINFTTPGAFINQSKYGMEGGQILLINDTFYLFTTEFTGDPLYVPSNLTLWSITMNDFLDGNIEWRKLSTIFQSGGTCDCNNTRASLGAGITAAFNETDKYWYIYYVGFQSCNDSYFVNQNGRIWVAKSVTQGYMNGIKGPYKDIEIIMKYPDTNSQPWEGLQGVDSFSNPWKVNSTHYFSFYGSAQTQNAPNVNQAIGLAYSTQGISPGKWTRADYPIVNPVKLIDSPLECPVITQFDDGTFGTVFDALSYQQYGDVGYSWSPDGIHWHTNCSQLLTVNPPDGLHWGDARTPVGLIQINDTHLWLFFTGWDRIQSNYESFGVVIVSWV